MPSPTNTLTKSYVADGLTTLFAIPFVYLLSSYVKVFINGVATTAFTFASGTTINMNVLPALGTVITIARETSTMPLVTFEDAAGIGGDDLNLAVTQALQLIEETSFDTTAFAVAVSATHADVISATASAAAAAASAAALAAASAAVASVLAETVQAADYATLALADAAAVAAGRLLVISTMWGTVPAALNASIRMLPGGMLMGSGTVAINGQFEGCEGCFGSSMSVTGLKESKPEWFGSNTSPGTTVMTSALQKAASSLASYGTLTLKGSYLTDAITIQSNSLVAATPGTLLTLVNASATKNILFFPFGASNINIQGISFDGNVANQSNWQDWTGSIGTHGNGGLTNITITNCIFKNNSGFGILIGGAITSRNTNIVITNNQFSNWQKGAAYVFEPEGVAIEGNVADNRGATASAYPPMGFAVGSGRNGRISNNKVWLGQGGTAGQHNLAYSWQSVSGDTNVDFGPVWLTNNFADCGNYAQVFGCTIATNYGIITGNHFQNCNGANAIGGIEIGNLQSTPAVFHVTHNTLLNTVGIAVNGILTNSDISNNSIIGYTLKGIGFSSDSNGSIGNTVAQNHISGAASSTAHGIYVNSSGSSLLDIVNNIVHDIAGIGIVVASGNNKTRIVSNSIYNCAAEAFSLNSTSLTVRDNYTYGNGANSYIASDPTNIIQNNVGLLNSTLQVDPTPLLNGTTVTLAGISSTFYVTNAGATTLTTISGGVPGQEITLWFSNANTTVSNGGGNIVLQSAFTSAANKVLKLVMHSNTWYEVSRSN